MESALARDIVFRRFVGLGMADAVPDHSALWRFRNHPAMEKLQESLLQDINEQLAKKSLYVNAGVISIVERVLSKRSAIAQTKIKKGITRKIRKRIIT